MSTPAQHRVFYPENETTRASRAEAYDELRTEVVRRQAHRRNIQQREGLLRIVLYGAVLAVLAYILFGIGTQPRFPLF